MTMTSTEPNRRVIFFHRAFFQYFEGTKIEKGKVKTIMNYVSLGYSFKSIENMALKHSFHIFEQKLLQNKNFPSLRTLKLENIKLEGLGEHKRLLDLTLGSCEYDWSEDTNKNQGGFPFPFAGAKNRKRYPYNAEKQPSLPGQTKDLGDH